jgi:hypothetical protein
MREMDSSSGSITKPRILEPTFHLPQFNLKKVNTVIRGYYAIGGPAGNGEVAAKLGWGYENRISIAGNFLNDLGITKGAVYARELTNAGDELGGHLQYSEGDDTEEVKESWRKIIRENRFLQLLLGEIKKKGRIDQNEIKNLIFRKAGYTSPTDANKVGAKVLVDLLLFAGYITKDKGVYVVSDELSNEIRPVAFVLMPFRDPYDEYYRVIIKPAAEEAGLRSLRADEIFGPTEIVKDIWKAIKDAGIIVAELTTRNPNVMYELGLSHAIGKPVIMLSQNIDDIPFDLRSLRCILYNTVEPNWAEQLHNDIKQSIMAVISGKVKDNDFLQTKEALK